MPQTLIFQRLSINRFRAARKPGSVSGNHLSRRTVTSTLQRPTSRAAAGRRTYCPVLVLLRMGFTRELCYHNSRDDGELLPHHFNLTTALPVSAVCFCCTFPIVTYARRYLASSPCGARTFLIHPEDARACLNYPKPCAFQQSFSIISSQRGQCPLPIG